MEHRDVVVIGAGLAGLSAAAHLAQDGYRPLVLEHHAVPGGFAHEFTRRGFRFEVALHALDGAGPGGWLYGMLNDLGVLDRIELRRLDPLYRVRLPDFELTAHADINEYRHELIELFPGESEGIASFLDAVQRVGRDVAAFARDRASGLRRSPMEMMQNYPDMSNAFTQNWADFLAAHVTDDQLQTALSTLWGYFGLPPSRMSAGLFAAALSSYHLNGGYYPIGGSMALSRALEDVIVEAGGSILYRNTVTGMDIDDGLIRTVSTHRGDSYEADIFISTASPVDTIGFVGAEHFGDAYVEQMTSDAPALSNLVVYLGVEGDLAAEGWPHHEYFVEDGYDLESGYQAVVDGDFDRAGMVITNYTQSDPGCAPDGHSVLVLMTLAPWDFAGVWGTDGDLTDYSTNPAYLEVKEAAGKALIRRADRLIPGLSDRIVIKEIATPLTNVRYGRQPYGSIYGREQTVENMFAHRRSPRTPIDNLFLAGAWIAGGGMSTAMGSGRTAAALAGKALAG
ncbi:MAG: NAD(P)/FAD-dependent oxidoreductase [Acidimicrobiia bacterium]|nr:NAD(P)/FAD-dependent oxidoreductase [Acidimicrobiia bacterium]